MTPEPKKKMMDSVSDDNNSLNPYISSSTNSLNDQKTEDTED